MFHVMKSRKSHCCLKLQTQSGLSQNFSVKIQSLVTDNKFTCVISCEMWQKNRVGELICQSIFTNRSCLTRFTSEKTAKMAGQTCFGVSEVYTWLSSISHGLNLERLAPEFERRGFQSMHSLKYIWQNDLEVIINSPDKLLLAERILEKELEEIKKQSVQPKRLFPSPYTGSLQVVSPINSPACARQHNQVRPGFELIQRASKSNQESTKRV